MSEAEKKKCKFKVGDIVIGNKDAGKHYSYTGTGWKGKVMQIDPSSGDDIRVTAADKDNDGSFWVSSKYFDLYESAKPTKKSLGPDKAKGTISNKEAFELLFGFAPQESDCPTPNCYDCPYSSNNGGDCSSSHNFWRSPYQGRYRALSKNSLIHRTKTGSRRSTIDEKSLKTFCDLYNKEGDSVGLKYFKEKELWTTEEQYRTLNSLLMMNELIYTHNSETITDAQYGIEFAIFLDSIGVALDKEGYAFIKKNTK